MPLSSMMVQGKEEGNEKCQEEEVEEVE